MFARFFSGGDRESIEQYVFALLADCGCKYTKNIPMMNDKDEKNERIGNPLSKVYVRNREKGTGKQGERRHVTGRETASYQIRAGARPDMLERSVETEFYSFVVSCLGK